MDIASWNNAGSIWLQWMIMMSWQVAIVVGILLLLIWPLRRAPASLRAGLWLIVFIKLFIPPWIAIPFSFGGSVSAIGQRVPAAGETIVRARETMDTFAATAPSETLSLSVVLFAVWIAVSVVLLSVALYQYRSFSRLVLKTLKYPDARTTGIAERVMDRFNMPNAVPIRVSKVVDTPCVFGVIRPIIVLSEACESRYSESALTAIIAHEVGHIRRHDLFLSGLLLVATCLYWFHPLVWVASAKYRKEREMACDDLVMRNMEMDGADYAKTLVDVVEDARMPAPAAAGYLGAVETGVNLQQRMRSAGDAKRVRVAAAWTWIAAFVFACFILPMGVSGEFVAVAAEPAGPEDPPQVVKTSPAIGATDVDPATTELSLTFNRAMAGGMSWTGGGEVFPEFTDKPTWDDESLVCTAPVKLEAGKFYRVGVNASSYRNFQSVEGTPSQFNVLYFVTKGASAEEKAKADKPTATLSPANGATDVDPTTTKLTVTFDKEMSGGMSWTKAGGQLPEGTGSAEWNADKTACTLPVKLEPGTEYTIGINHPYANNFQTKWGVPADVIVWNFTTAAE